MRHSRAPLLHLVHPRPVPWHTLIAPIAAELGVPLVSYENWFTALENSISTDATNEVEAMRLNPALRLLPFYRSQQEAMAQDRAREREPMGLVRLSTEKATAVSGALARMRPLDEERAKGWFAAWRRAGFL